MSVAAPRPASTVVLLRDGVSGVEVFLVRRHRDIAFMGGAHVFPGGGVDESDSDQGYVHHADGLASAVARMAGENRRAAIGFHVAAIREAFEESGVLLARDSNGDMVSLPQQDAVETAAQRQAISRSPAGLLQLVRERNWRVACDALVYFAHWVTPETETRRFDTRFFLAAAPAQQVATHDAGETTESQWVLPGAAIARSVAGEIALPPPTWTTLRCLEPFERVDDALAWARRKVVPRIEPRIVLDDETRMVLLPGDPALPAIAGFEAKETRFLLSGGRWTPVSPP